jgi:hypothetical protein
VQTISTIHLVHRWVEGDEVHGEQHQEVVVVEEQPLFDCYFRKEKKSSSFERY